MRLRFGDQVGYCFCLNLLVFDCLEVFIFIPTMTTGGLVKKR